MNSNDCSQTCATKCWTLPTPTSTRTSCSAATATAVNSDPKVTDSAAEPVRSAWIPVPSSATPTPYRKSTPILLISSFYHLSSFFLYVRICFITSVFSLFFAFFSSAILLLNYQPRRKQKNNVDQKNKIRFFFANNQIVDYSTLLSKRG